MKVERRRRERSEGKREVGEGNGFGGGWTVGVTEMKIFHRCGNGFPMRESEKRRS